MERLNQLYRDLVHDADHMRATLNTMRHVLLEVTEEYGRIKRENEALKVELERLKAR